MAEFHEGSATNLSMIQTGTVACVVTSPPYNCGIDYGPDVNDALSWGDYEFLVDASVWEMRRVLMDGGRVWVNIQATVPAHVGQVGGRRVHLAKLWADHLHKYGFQYRDTIVWIQDSFDGACAWGSWARPSAPNMRGSHELILVFSKGEWKRNAPKWIEAGWKGPREDLGGDWVDLTRNVWKINPRKSDYPATFPIDLPARAIRLSTWPGEVVLDPFAGSGTTLDAADQLGRKGVGVDLQVPSKWQVAA